MYYQSFKILILWIISCWALCSCANYISPIEIRGKQFVDSNTNQPFYVKGVDYQPGGSSEVNTEKDPLSDPDTCARDIYLLQELGVNTIRIYSINPDLNHDKCMTMLAAAGIYLLLDVNSPLQNQHLNRYEPWTSYNEIYLEHIFKVLESFTTYNNTLGFFAGNEVINDKKSAKLSPPFVKMVVSDLKQYSKTHFKRVIPIGYSAADDLDYRSSLADYLECTCSAKSEFDSVDFYGVNSYQWCGTQTMESSGYNKLVDAYSNYTKPVILSEFGCNLVQPRAFGEIEALYSKEMYTTFSGGLVYEYSQEPNNYGLVKIETDGSVKLLPDYNILKQQYQKVTSPTTKEVLSVSNDIQMKSGIQRKTTKPTTCKKHYQNLEIDIKTPKNLAVKLIDSGVKKSSPNYVDISDAQLQSKYKIYNENGQEINPKTTKIKVVNNIDSLIKSDNHSKSKQKSAASTTMISLMAILAAILVHISN